jgi:hypothetical protein
MLSAPESRQIREVANMMGIPRDVPDEEALAAIEAEEARERREGHRRPHPGR